MERRSIPWVGRLLTAESFNAACGTLRYFASSRIAADLSHSRQRVDLLRRIDSGTCLDVQVARGMSVLHLFTTA